MIALACALFTATASPGARQHVIIVGVNESRDDGVAPLSFADDDAARYSELLAPEAATLHVLSVLDVESQRLFPDVASRARPPTHGELTRALHDVFSALARDRDEGREADLVFIYVGHGAVGDDGEGYVSLADAKLTRTELFNDVIAPSPARFNHVIVDACSAFHLLNRGGASDRVRRLVERAELAGHPNTGVLLATSADVETHEWSRVRGGVFSHEVLSALSGAADVDGDGSLRYDEVGAFIEAANAGVSDRRARVDFFLQPPRLFLERPLKSTSTGARVALGARDEGRFVVEDARGVVVAEVHKNAEQPLALALVGAAPFRISRGDDVWLTADKPRATAVALSSLQRASESDKLAARSGVSDALERGLFTQPFGKSYVRGYAARLAKDLEVPDVDESAPSASSPLATIGWTSATLGAATLLAGGIVAYIGVDAALAAEDGKGRLNAFEAQDLIDRANISFGIASGLAAAGLVVGGVGVVVANTAGNREPEIPEEN